MTLIPGVGRSHMAWSSQAHEPQLLSPNPYSPCSATRGTIMMRSPGTTVKGSLGSLQLEKDCTHQWRPSTAKTKTNKWEKKLKTHNLIKRRRQWHPTPVLLPGISHGWRSLVGCSPWGCEELDTTERLHFHFSLSRIGEGNGNPLQCSCLENPRDGGAWWAAVYGVTQSQTGLKQLSSSSSSSSNLIKIKTNW